MSTLYGHTPRCPQAAAPVVAFWVDVVPGGQRHAAVNPGPEADRVRLAHVRDCLDRIREYTNAERARFEASRLVQDAVIRNLQTLAESSPRLSSEVKGTQPKIPWR